MFQKLNRMKNIFYLWFKFFYLLFSLNIRNIIQLKLIQLI